MQEDFTNKSLHSEMERYGAVPYKADKIIEIGTATEYDAIHLEVTAGGPIAIVHTITEDRDGNIIEYAVSRVPVDKLRIEMTVYNSRGASV